MPRASRTISPLHFEDFEPHRFEDLIRQLAYKFRSWRFLDATGRLGSDGGLDIRGIEGVPQKFDFGDESDSEEVIEATSSAEGAEWRIQCKRYKSISTKLMREIVKEVVPDETPNPPYGVIVAAACDVSARTMAAFHDEAARRNVGEHRLWTKAHLEDLLFLPENDHLLFAYFGISLSVAKRSRLQELRARIALKRRLLRAFGNDSMRSPINRWAVVRDIEDISYPYEEAVEHFQEIPFPPWHLVWVRSFYPHGLLVTGLRYEGWLKPDGEWDILVHKESIRRRDSSWGRPSGEWERIQQLVPDGQYTEVDRNWILPLDNIIEVDATGEVTFGPNNFDDVHIFCDFADFSSGPYAVSEDGKLIEIWTTGNDFLELDNDKRTSLFPPGFLA